MADLSSSIFNKKATEKLRNPDDLEKYIRLTNPSILVILGACAALIAGLLSWGVFGSVSTSVSLTGVLSKDQVMCFLPTEDAAKVHVGDMASVAGEHMKVSKISTIPISRDEAKSIIPSDYLVSTLMGEDWAYQVIFEGDTSKIAPGIPLSVNITTERIAPLSVILGDAA